MAKTTVGVDIGSGELKLVQWDGGRVHRAVRRTMPDNLVRSDHIISFEAMADFIKETAREERISGKNCAVVLPANQVYLRRVTMPAMNVEQLGVNLPYEFRDFLTMNKDKYFYDYSVNDIRQDESGAPVEMDLTAAAVAKETIAEYRDMFRRAGFRLKTAVPAECAYANLLRALPVRECCIIDIGHAQTKVHFFTGARFETSRVIDIGLSTVDAAIADASGVDEHTARTYRQSNHENTQEAEAARNVYGAIALDIRKAVNFYGFNNRESDLRDAWCIGGGAHIPALCSAVAQAVDLTLHPISELLSSAAEETEAPGFFTAAIGAAMQ